MEIFAENSNWHFFDSAASFLFKTVRKLVRWSSASYKLFSTTFGYTFSKTPESASPPPSLIVQQHSHPHVMTSQTKAFGLVRLTGV